MPFGTTCSANGDRGFRRHVAAIWLLLACWPGSNATLGSEAPQPPLDQWITQLDDDQYATRERAQQQLEQTGLSALKAVGDAARSGSLESSTRAINILITWSESHDSVLQIAALEKLVDLPNRPESEMAAGVLANVREQAALEAIVALGGHHTLDMQNRGVFRHQQQAPLQVTIGPDWKGGVEGLKHLSAIRRATTISFHSTTLDDKALAQLPKLKLPNVQRIEFYGTKMMSTSGIEKLRARIPTVNIAVRSAARLGIQGFHQNGGAQVNGIMPGSAAEKAGLQPGDLITEMEGEKVEDFTALTDRIAKHQPGDTVVFSIVRNGNVQELKVTFDRWGADISNSNNRAPSPSRTLTRVPRRINLELR